jgi:hypothetical protein
MANFSVVEKSEIVAKRALAPIPADLLEVCTKVIGQLGESNASKVDLEEGDDPKLVRRALNAAAESNKVAIAVRKKRNSGDTLYVFRLSPAEAKARETRNKVAAEKRKATVAKKNKSNGKASK